MKACILSIISYLPHDAIAASTTPTVVMSYSIYSATVHFIYIYKMYICELHMLCLKSQLTSNYKVNYWMSFIYRVVNESTLVGFPTEVLWKSTYSSNKKVLLKTS